MKKEDIRVSVTGDLLFIEGERKAEKEVKDEDYYCCERAYGKFYREILLPASVPKEKIDSDPLAKWRERSGTLYSLLYEVPSPCYSTQSFIAFLKIK